MAQRANDQIRTSSVNWTILNNLSHQIGPLTSGILHHVMFWFDSQDRRKSAAKDVWTDLLKAGPFATRVTPNSDILMHAGKAPNEAARLLVQALFDKMREIVALEQDYSNTSTGNLVSLIVILLNLDSNLSRSVNLRAISIKP